MTPYYEADGVALYLGDMREVLPALALAADAVITDSPYGETSLAWDRWQDGWPAAVLPVTRQLWAFGSMRMFLEHVDEFDGWKLAQDIVWEKQQGSGFAADRFSRVHEHALHWYRGAWSDVYRDPQREAGGLHPGHVLRRPANGTPHAGTIAAATAVGDGTRLVRSVIRVRNMRRRALHPTEKPAGILRPLIAYSCPRGGVVIDCFAGSGSTLAVARELGRRAVGVEADEATAEIAARRLSAAPLPFPGDAAHPTEPEASP